MFRSWTVFAELTEIFEKLAKIADLDLIQAFY